MHRRPGPVFRATAMAVAGAMLVWAGSLLIPDRYISTAVIRVDAESFPATDIISEAWASAASRLNLKSLIEQFKLYPAERERLPLEDVIEAAKSRDLAVNISPNLDVRVSFTYSDASAAQVVAGTFMAKMIDASRKWSKKTGGRLELKEVAGPAEPVSTLAFWRPRRYTSVGTLRTTAKDAGPGDQMTAENQAEHLRQKALHELRTRGEWTIRRDHNLLFIHHPESDAKRAQLEVSKLIDELIEEVRFPSDCGSTHTPPSSRAPIAYSHLEPIGDLAGPDLVGAAVPRFGEPASQPTAASGTCAAMRPLSILDPASLPSEPEGPNRYILAAFGFFLGLGLFAALKPDSFR